MIGRKKELQRFKEAMESDQSEFIAVYGRRRVGKTFLIRQAFANRFTFAHTGVARESMAGQLANFHDSLVEYGSEDCPGLKGRPEGRVHRRNAVDGHSPLQLHRRA